MGRQHIKGDEMAITRKSAAAVAVAASVAVTLAGCGSSGSSGSGSKGGTLYYLIGKGTVEKWDPQSMYVGRDLNNASRLWSRGLVQLPVGEDHVKDNEPVADLATNTGTATDNNKTWSFTLKNDVKWQDGQPVTCADLKYGVSRTFATDVITGGPSYARGYLDIPQKNGQPIYDGPYKKDNQAAFDKAVVCSTDNKTITYHFNKPWPDFPKAIANLTFFNPYRQDKDQGAKSNFAVFSDGPYMLQGSWNANTGGTFVRNPQYVASTDPVRKAYPDKIVFSEGNDTTTIYQRLFADGGNDQFAITERRVPATMYAQLNNAGISKREKNWNTNAIDYLTPNVKRLSPKVRQALALSTDTASWISVGGGPKAFIPAYSVVPPSVVGYAKNPAFTQGFNPTKAKQILQSAGVKMPYPIKFTYQSLAPVNDKQAAALQQGWDAAGFKVSLNPLTDTYYNVVNNPSSDTDVTWAGWGPDWPSMSTVIPPLFDGRLNLTGTTNNNDYGNYNSPAVNALIDQAYTKSTVAEQAAVFEQADIQLGKDVAYIPLEQRVYQFLYGSKVKNFTICVETDLPDLGAIAVQ